MENNYKKPNRKRNERLTIRLTQDEKRSFCKLAEDNNLNYTDLLLVMIKKMEDENNGLYSK